MSCPQCQGIVQEFDSGWARRELERYRRRGATGTTGRLVRAILDQGPMAGRSFLDVGGGVGVIQHELAAAGAAHGTHVDASPAYLAAARSEAERRGHAARIRYMEGDFVDFAADIEPADVVTLDRAVCCYPDMPALVDASASHARRLYGLVFPREHFINRLGTAAINVIQALRRHPFRVFLHRTAEIHARVERHGLRRIHSEYSPLWQLHLYIKDGDATADASAPVSNGPSWTSPS